MGTDEPSEIQKIVLDMKVKGRSDKDKGTLKKDIKAIQEYTKNRLQQLKEKEKLEKEEETEKSLLLDNVPYKTYVKLMTDKEVKTYCDYDSPIGNFNIILEEANLRPDKAYFWMLDFVTNKFHLGYDNVIKSEDSVMFGAMSQYGSQYQQVRGGKQQIAQQYLKTISEVMRSLFPLLYEIKQSDELLSVYDVAKEIAKYKTLDDMEEPKNRRDAESCFSAERMLRDKWASEVDAGKIFILSKPQSQQGAGYVLLPHWFFSIKIRHPAKDETWPEVIQDAIDRLVNQKSINEEVANVLANFLLRFKIWQQESAKQLQATRDFKISYLRQQYANIRLYIEWLKPMLKTIQQMGPKLGRHSQYGELSSDITKMSPENNPNIYNVLDTNQLFLEFIAYKSPKKDEPEKNKFYHEKYYQVVIVSITHRTTSLTFDIGGQNQNLPFGSNDIKIKGFAWTKEQFEMYLRKKEDVEFDILESLYDSMKEVREQVEKYLKSEIDTKYAEDLKLRYPEYYPEQNMKSLKSFKQNMFAMSSMLGPFKHVLSGFYYGFKPMIDIFQFNPQAKKNEELKEFRESKQLYDVTDKLKSNVFSIYDVYKRANRLTVW